MTSLPTDPEGGLAPDDLGNNKLHHRDRAIHDWYRFVLSYPPHLVRHYMQRFDLGPESVILDPFCGTGTTLVEAKKAGIASVGIEAVPMAHFASRTKTHWSIQPDALRMLCDRVLNRANARVDRPPFLRFSPEQTAIVLKNSIAPAPLHKCLVLAEAIAAESPSPARDILELALAYVAVNDASNLKFGPEVGIRRNKREDVVVFKTWAAKVAQMADDLAIVAPHSATPSCCHCADARALTDLLEPQSIDAIITSPPYPNEKDYTRTTRLESVLLGFLKNKDDLRTFKQRLIRSNTRNVYKVDDDDRLLAEHSAIATIAAEIEAKRVSLKKTSGFERLYHRVITLYFGGMKRHLTDLRPALKPGAKLAYVVGDQASFFQVMVRTGTLLADIAEEVGYEVREIAPFRTRVATITGAQLQEQVVVLEWSGSPRKTQHFV